MLGIGAALGWHQAQSSLGMGPPAGLRAIDPVAADLSAQQWMATWAMWMFGATAIQVVVGAVGLYFILASFRQSRDAADLSRRAYAAERRTWMEITSFNLREAWRAGDEIRGSFSLVAQNVGNTPATDVRIFLQFVAAGMYLPTREAVEQVAINYLEETSLGTSVLPQRTTTQGFSVPARKDATAEASDARVRAENPGLLAEKTNLAVIFGVVYRSLGSDEWNYTVNMSLLTKAYTDNITQPDWRMTGEEIGLMQMYHFSQIA